MYCAPPPHLGGGFACRLPEPPIESYRSMIRCYSTRICRHHTIRTTSSASGFIMPARRIEFMASILDVLSDSIHLCCKLCHSLRPSRLVLVFYVHRHSALQQALLFEFTPGCQVSLWARSESSAKEISSSSRWDGRRWGSCRWNRSWQTDRNRARQGKQVTGMNPCPLPLPLPLPDPKAT